jgi:hypothetical protein
METKEIAVLKLRQIDLIQEEIDKLKQSQDDIRFELLLLKQKVKDDNKHLIGKKALCSNVTDKTFKDIFCICAGVICNEYYEAIPVFNNLNGKKVHVDYYDWV